MLRDVVEVGFNKFMLQAAYGLESRGAGLPQKVTKLILFVQIISIYACDIHQGGRLRVRKS
jgi:hypothetical protein